MRGFIKFFESWTQKASLDFLEKNQEVFCKLAVQDLSTSLSKMHPKGNIALWLMAFGASEDDFIKKTVIYGIPTPECEAVLPHGWVGKCIQTYVKFNKALQKDVVFSAGKFYHLDNITTLYNHESMFDLKEIGSDSPPTRESSVNLKNFKFKIDYMERFFHMSPEGMEYMGQFKKVLNSDDYGNTIIDANKDQIIQQVYNTIERMLQWLSSRSYNFDEKYFTEVFTHTFPMDEFMNCCKKITLIEEKGFEDSYFYSGLQEDLCLFTMTEIRQMTDCFYEFLKDYITQFVEHTKIYYDRMQHELF